MRAGGNGVFTAFMPGMATTQSADGEVCSFEHPMCGNCFLCVMRAAGIETAVIAQKRTHADSVTGDDKNEQTSHHESGLASASFLVAWRVSFCHCCCNIEDSCALSKSLMPLRARRTTSMQGCVGGSCRKNSRATLFTRLRCTARRTFFFAITRPIR